MALQDRRQSGRGARPRAIHVVGGQNRISAALLHNFEGFQKGLILALDEAGGQVETVVDYRSPAEFCPDSGSSVLFKSASLVGDRLYGCTQTEILIYRLPEFVLETHISLPVFNDVHHVTPAPDGSLLVACTGLDAVFQISRNGAILREWELTGKGLWHRFDRATDYRKIASTKPHLVHPNFVFLHGEEIWVTRLQQRDALRLEPSPLCLPIEVERPHDGILFDGRVYFTTVDGHIVRADPVSAKVEAVFDLAKVFATDDPLGWCRGLKILDCDRVIVGFSRLRATVFQDHLRWAVRKLKGSWGSESRRWDARPTRISCLDLTRGKVLWETSLEPWGLNAVFSIL